MRFGRYQRQVVDLNFLAQIRNLSLRFRKNCEKDDRKGPLSDRVNRTNVAKVPHKSPPPQVETYSTLG